MQSPGTSEKGSRTLIVSLIPVHSHNEYPYHVAPLRHIPHLFDITKLFVIWNLADFSYADKQNLLEIVFTEL